ncbi:MAG: glycosyltransferase family 2 protein [Carboxylicivirga sp.]|jgi:dolichol-phosphate mannosyltransferase|nr:glycosyltransferase family 2 protein [Carboxylicivirga sp.]
MNHPHISIISPVYRAENIVEELVTKIKQHIEQITDNFEIILVNDCSPDNSWIKILQEARKDKRVKGINLSRNFGQHQAITAGLKYSKGDWSVVMDCDLQDRPDEIVNLYNKANEGWEIVLAKRVDRQDKLSKRLSSKIFYLIYGLLSGIRTDCSIANFGIYHSKVINEYNKMTELARSFPSLIQHLGFKSCTIDVKHSERSEGASSYTLFKLLNLAGDVIISNSNKPLKISIKLGFTISTLSFLFALYNITAYLLGFITVPGFTSTIFSIWFVGGLILTFMGILGLYIGKIFNQVKGRQLFIVSNEINT